MVHIVRTAHAGAHVRIASLMIARVMMMMVMVRMMIHAATHRAAHAVTHRWSATTRTHHGTHLLLPGRAAGAAAARATRVVLSVG